MNVFSLRSATLAGLGLAAMLPPVFAQTTPTTPATCTSAPASLSALNVERTLSFTNNNGPSITGLFTTMTPAIPANLLAAVSSGALEVREQITLTPNTQTNTNVVTIQGFTVAPGSPTPSPSANIPFSSVLYKFQVQIDNMYFSCSPAPGGLLVGKVVDNYPVSPFGDLTGAAAAIGFGFTTDTPPKINNLTLLIAGIAGLYTSSGTGTLTFPTPVVNPPGSAGNGPQIIFAPGQGAFMATSQRSFTIDVSPSKDPNNLQVAFTINQLTSNLPNNDSQAVNSTVSIANGNTNRPTITFPSARGNYYFVITATNSQGGSSSQQVVIQYYGQ